MAQSKYNPSEVPSIELYQDYLSRKYDLQISYASTSADVVKKLEQKYMYELLDEQIKVNRESLAKQTQEVRARRQAELQHELDEIELARKERNQADIDLHQERLKRIEDEIAEETRGNRAALDMAINAKREAEAKLTAELNQINQTRFANQYKIANIYDRKALADARKNGALELKLTLANNLKAQQQERNHINAQLRAQRKKLAEAAAGSDEEYEATKAIENLEKEKETITSSIQVTKSQIAEATRDEAKWADEAAKNNARVRAAEEAKLSATERYTKARERQKELKEQIEATKREIATNEELGIDTTALKETLAEFTTEFDEIGSKIGDHAKAATKEQKAKQKSEGNQIKNILSVLKSKVTGEEATQEAQADAEDFKTAVTEKAKQDTVNAVQGAIQNGLNQIDQNIESFFEYQASINARLQGANNDYQKIVGMVQKNVGISGITSQKEVLANIKKLVDSGVAYDLEARAYLATMSEDIANSFDAFSADLARMIRLQQADITASRLGMEAALLTFFNENFKDSSYLTDAADQVTSAIFDASAQLSRDESLAFEYMTQKWLGALYSLGLSQEATSKIAEGLNYLGTGNVDALNGNDSLQTLMAMSASNAGISYADILTQGLNSDTTNKLLKSMVEYLSNIATNTENQVTKAAYANLFSLSMSDMKTLSTLNQTDIDGIYNASLNYASAMQETSNQLSQIVSRTHLSQIVDTAFENAMATSSLSIGNNIAGYATWKVLNVIEELTGGIALPFVNVMGFGVDLNTTVTQLAKTGIAGLGLMGGLLSSLFGGSLFGTSDLNKWGYQEYNSRGSQIKGIAKGVSSGKSASSDMNMTGSASSSDVKNSTMSEGAATAEEDSKITNESTADQAQDTKEYTDKVLAALGYGEVTVIEELTSMHEHMWTSMTHVEELLALTRTFKTSGGIDTFQSDVLTILNSVDRTTQETNATMFASVASSMLTTAVDYAKSNYTDNSASVVETALEFASSAISTVNATKELTDMLATANVLNMGATRVAIESLEESLNTSKADSITNLSAMNDVLKTEVSAQETGAAMTQKVKLEEISQTLRDTLRAELRTLIASAMADALINKIAGSEEETDTVMSRLKTTLDGLSVVISDDSLTGIGSAIASGTQGAIIGM